METIKEQIIKLYEIKDVLEEEGYEHLAKDLLDTAKSLESSIEEIKNTLTELKEKISNRI